MNENIEKEEEKEETHIYYVTIKIEEIYEIEAQSEDEAQTTALEAFKMDCNSSRWIDTNTDIEVE